MTARWRHPFGITGMMDRPLGGQRRDPHQRRNPAGNVPHRRFGHRLSLVIGQVGQDAGAAQRGNAVNSGGQQAVDQSLSFVEIDRAVLAERSDRVGDDAFERNAGIHYFPPWRRAGRLFLWLLHAGRSRPGFAAAARSRRPGSGPGRCRCWCGGARPKPECRPRRPPSTRPAGPRLR